MNLNSIKKICEEKKFRPKKTLGQNFLVDNNVRRKLINAYSIKSDETVLEIGPGLGAMTLPVSDVCGQVIAVEKDHRICEIMRPVFNEKGNIILVEDDFLQIGLGKYAKSGKLKVVGNVPYYITTPIIEKLLDQRKFVTSAFLVVQDEMATRISSPPGSRDYGSLSCFIQYFADAGKVFKIKKNCFYPKPRVESCLLRLDMLQKPRVRVSDEDLFFRIIRKAFSQRRKKMINPLSKGDIKGLLKEDWIRVLLELGINTAARAEDLSLEEYARIANKLSE